MLTDVTPTLEKILAQRIMLLDGAMGTMIQEHKLEEADFRGEAFANHPIPLKGNNDLLSITRPDLIEAIHESYFNAGADFACTNSFNATTIAQADYELENAVRNINYAAAQCARKAADKWNQKTPSQPRFVVGALGPTSRTASMSPDVNDPGKRLVTFDQLRAAYYEAGEALLEGGADILMLETIFDTLNAKAGIFAVAELQERYGHFPLMISGTITDASGRTLSGQTAEAFYISVMHSNMLSIGLNCALGAKDMVPYVKRLDQIANCYVTAHPNAGLPNEFGEYDQTAQQMVNEIEPFVKGGHVNIIGGCCGTTPEHIRALKTLADNHAPRTLKNTQAA